MKRTFILILFAAATLAKPLAGLDAPQLTQEGTITGSPLFMSPE